MRYAVIQDSIVVNVLEADPDHLPELPGVELVPSKTAGIGWTYADGTFKAPPAQPAAPAPDPAEWLIDVGPFFDRFGPAKLAVLASSDATVRALVTDLQVRKWIDLKRADVAQGIDLLTSKSIPGLDAARKSAILNAPVQPVENLALRKDYFA